MIFTLSSFLIYLFKAVNTPLSTAFDATYGLFFSFIYYLNTSTMYVGIRSKAGIQIYFFADGQTNTVY